MRSRAFLTVSLLLLASALTAGCFEDSGTPAGPNTDTNTDTEYRLSGTFTENATQNDTADFSALVQPYGKGSILESHPMQFQVQGLTGAECAELQGRLEEKAYVASVRACDVAQDSDDPAGPVSNDASGDDVDYRVNGTFVENATQEDVDALQALAREHGGDAIIMESHPMRFTVTDFDEPACENLRDALADVTYVAEFGACERVEPTGDDADEPTSDDA